MCVLAAHKHYLQKITQRIDIFLKHWRLVGIFPDVRIVTSQHLVTTLRSTVKCSEITNEPLRKN